MENATSVASMTKNFQAASKSIHGFYQRWSGDFPNELSFNTYTTNLGKLRAAEAALRGVGFDKVAMHLIVQHDLGVAKALQRGSDSTPSLQACVETMRKKVIALVDLAAGRPIVERPADD
jgi:hypothetical protein